MTAVTWNFERCAARDREDPLRAARARFQLPPDQIYLVGHSLGAMPVDVHEAMQRVLRSWGAEGVGGWNRSGWLSASERIGERLAPLLGARSHEVICADSTTVNLFRLLGAALTSAPARRRILVEEENFPADNYIVDGIAQFVGGDHEVLRVPGAALADAIDARVAVVVASHVNYRSGRVLPMRAVCAAARASGAITLWDLAHSAGAVEIALNDAGADLAVGCGYKYLSGGPGAPAFMFVREGMQSSLRAPMWGWLGHEAPFSMAPIYRPAEGMRRFLCGTPPILSMAALEAALAVLEPYAPVALAAKATALGEVFASRLEGEAAEHGLVIEGGTDRAAHGAHVLVQHPDAKQLALALAVRGVKCDYRAP
ncbi:MAG: aminotransferase class V-fold PLP-dependent enzyme, partial [Nannocystaceae bacterium]